MTYEELSKLPIGTIVVDDADEELGRIESGRFFHVIQWDNGCRTTLNNEGSRAKTATLYRPEVMDSIDPERCERCGRYKNGRYCPMCPPHNSITNS